MSDQGALRIEARADRRLRLYRWYDAGGVLLYVGVTNNPHLRAVQHGISSWWYRFADHCMVEDRRADDKAQAEQWEREAIAAEAPVFNRTADAIGYVQRQRSYLAAQGIDYRQTKYGDFPPPPKPRLTKAERLAIQARLAAEKAARAEKRRHRTPPA